ncbi:hypothetical protein BJY52DRAFT_1322191 [Lactarius psammicola]|nr:hypothetical protein BJY52DRAFT_1322191 [Lactarius psammicola]
MYWCSTLMPHSPPLLLLLEPTARVGCSDEIFYNNALSPSLPLSLAPCLTIITSDLAFLVKLLPENRLNGKRMRTKSRCDSEGSPVIHIRAHVV